ncbi:AAA family ATPase [Pseudodesulfovibrio methanolicus]|uniref:AAA family ATPase n=1 Tax=Pseudodesulfovibrio methanolicus TaxID=3126690 RepID=A0ABZ2IZH4_9BACT
MEQQNRSEIRQSEIADLLDKVKKHSFGKYLLKTSMSKIRGFCGEDIVFDFPVTALIGPNGSGKSSVLGAAACAYKIIKPGMFFPKSAIGDDSMSGWRAEYELIDKETNPRQLIRRNSNFKKAKWVRRDVAERPVLFFGIERTVPAGEKPRFKKLMRSTYRHTGVLENLSPAVAVQVSHILGKEVSEFLVASIGQNDDFLVGNHNGNEFSEFHFGAGESSIIRMVKEIESAPNNALLLIEEIENGLHPIATRCMVEYLIDVAKRKGIQSIFTTHSNDALMSLPNEAIWSCANGKLKQGKLDVESLRAVSGKIDKDVAIFVEDEFAKEWVATILRNGLRQSFERIGIYAVGGDGNAFSTHLHHRQDPSVESKSLCIVDGDSAVNEDVDEWIFRLAGEQPERTIYQYILDNVDEHAAVLAVSLHKSPDEQAYVVESIRKIMLSNRDPHLLFTQLGIELGFVAESIVRSAFLTLWARENKDFCSQLCDFVRRRLPA